MMFDRLLIVSYICSCQWLYAANPSLSDAEQDLYDQINAYRQQNGLAIISISPALTQVARIHVNDLNENPPSGSCNSHSWSNQGSWSSCCYTGNDTAACMWDKPKELSSYKHTGYENAYMNTGGVTVANSLAAWKNSSGHNEVILNKSIWSGLSWEAVGIALKDNYAVLWFGEEGDNSQFDNAMDINPLITDVNNPICEVAFLTEAFTLKLSTVTFADQVYRFNLDYLGNLAFQINSDSLVLSTKAISNCTAEINQNGRLFIPSINLFSGKEVTDIILNWDPDFLNDGANDLIFVLE